jgi:hypothetical protein
VSTPDEFYRSGQWRSLDRVLALINNYDDRMIAKKDLYRDIMNLRPTTLQADIAGEDLRED